MEDSINDGHATLVHCAAGVSRSVSIVLAYLVIKRNMSLADSIAMVRAARPIMNPNLGFLRQLITLETSVRGGAPSSVDADEYYLATMTMRTSSLSTSIFSFATDMFHTTLG